MYSIPSVINDVSRQFFEYVGETNREKLHNRRNGYAFQNPIIDPSGSRDPFWFNIEKFYGASDHQVHLDWDPRIPAVQFGNWPDAVYHSSDDSPANQDPTQMKRAAFLMIAVGNVFATAGPADAVAVAGVAVTYGQKRMAADLADALSLIASSTAATVHDDFKEARNLVRQAYLREWSDLQSATTLAMGDKTAIAAIQAYGDPLHAIEQQQFAMIQLAYRAAAARLGVTPLDAPVLTAAETAASKLVPKRKPGTPAQPVGNGGGGQGAGGAVNQPQPALSGYYAMEARNFADGERSLLDIRNALAAEFGPVTIDDVTRFFRDLESSATYTITQK
jgi:hypothetical protein